MTIRDASKCARNAIHPEGGLVEGRVGVSLHSQSQQEGLYAGVSPCRPRTLGGSHLQGFTPRPVHTCSFASSTLIRPRPSCTAGSEWLSGSWLMGRSEKEGGTGGGEEKRVSI